MRFKRVYVEITDVCNLRCTFCHGTRRAPRFLSPEEFACIARKLQGSTEYLYLHLLGEPLLHPALGEILEIAKQNNFYVNLTSNGFLLPEAADILLSAPALHRVNLSLQSWEANARAGLLLSDYVNLCARCSEALAEKGCIVSLRLWNGGGAAERNDEILRLLHAAFPGDWKTAQKNTVLSDRIFLEYGEKFDWPDHDAAETGTRFCHGLRDHIGVLCDGTVVPCCLDAEGDLALGNLLREDLDNILRSPRAVAIYEGFSRRSAVESLCRRCGYASRF